ncbi:hypothetical protein Y032_0156g3156 [Ancylostoma ceylanicum]|uniref:Uncharacterized protein n=1 Tax=Ancylostoma ceylanicum TaxID=53326 RepID=A0A016SZI5_9BILA|nr:hypothetical protein Y032_0156g3156 [Ancylostoma ceylanicum]
MKKGCDHAVLIGAFDPPVTPTLLNSYDAARECTTYCQTIGVRVQTGVHDGQPQCANQNRLGTPLFSLRVIHTLLGPLRRLPFSTLWWS